MTIHFLWQKCCTNTRCICLQLIFHLRNFHFFPALQLHYDNLRSICTHIVCCMLHMWVYCMLYMWVCYMLHIACLWVCVVGVFYDSTLCQWRIYALNYDAMSRRELVARTHAHTHTHPRKYTCIKVNLQFIHMCTFAATLHAQRLLSVPPLMGVVSSLCEHVLLCKCECNCLCRCLFAAVLPPTHYSCVPCLPLLEIYNFFHCPLKVSKKNYLHFSASICGSVI